MMSPIELNLRTKIFVPIIRHNDYPLRCALKLIKSTIDFLMANQDMEIMRFNSLIVEF